MRFQNENCVSYFMFFLLLFHVSVFICSTNMIPLFSIFLLLLSRYLISSRMGWQLVDGLLYLLSSNGYMMAIVLSLVLLNVCTYFISCTICTILIHFNEHLQPTSCRRLWRCYFNINIWIFFFMLFFSYLIFIFIFIFNG